MARCKPQPEVRFLRYAQNPCELDCRTARRLGAIVFAAKTAGCTRMASVPNSLIMRSNPELTGKSLAARKTAFFSRQALQNLANVTSRNSA